MEEAEELGASGAGEGGVGAAELSRTASLEELCAATIAENPDEALVGRLPHLRFPEKLVQEIAQTAADAGLLSDSVLGALLERSGRLDALCIDGLGEGVTGVGLGLLLSHVRRLAIAHADLSPEDAVGADSTCSETGSSMEGGDGVAESVEIERSRPHAALRVAEAAVRQCRMLERLSMRKCGLEDAGEVRRLLEAAGGRVGEVDLSDNAALDALGLFAPGSLLSMHSLTLRGCRATTNTCLPLLPRSLRSLSLAYTSVTSVLHFAHLAACPLTCLDVSGLALGNILLDAIQPLSGTLEQLRVDHGGLTTLLPLLEFVHLQELSVAHNPDLSHEAIARAVERLPSLARVAALDTGWDATRPQPELVVVDLSAPRKWEVM